MLYTRAIIGLLWTRRAYVARKNTRRRAKAGSLILPPASPTEVPISLAYRSHINKLELELELEREKGGERPAGKH